MAGASAGKSGSSTGAPAGRRCKIASASAVVASPEGATSRCTSHAVPSRESHAVTGPCAASHASPCRAGGSVPSHASRSHATGSCSPGPSARHERGGGSGSRSPPRANASAVTVGVTIAKPWRA